MESAAGRISRAHVRSLAPFPALTSASPELFVSIGSATPAVVPLAPAPGTLDDARARLEAGLRGASPDWRFRAARVLAVGDRLVVIAGDMSSTAAIASTGGDATTASELKLDGGSAQAIEGAFSGRLHPFHSLVAAPAEMAVTIGPVGPVTIALSPAPTTLAEARTLLAQSLTTAYSDSRFVNARVLVVDDWLFVLPGPPGGRVTFGPTPADRQTASQLGLVGRIAVDVRRGRVAFPLNEDPAAPLLVSYHYGFSGELGGGGYERGRWLVDPRPPGTLQLRVRKNPAPDEFASLALALQAWATTGKPNTIITILDSRTYADPLDIELRDDQWLAIQATDGERPHIQPSGGEIRINALAGHAGSGFTLSGLLIEGSIRVAGTLERLRLLHSTLVPGRALNEAGEPATTLPSIVAEGQSGGGLINAGLEVELVFSIAGSLRLPGHAAGVWIVDSIVEGVRTGTGTREAAIAATGTADQPGPPLTIERSTIFGRSYVRALPLASETIFDEPVVVTERQQGCVRFSYVPPGSTTPRRYRCQPDLEAARRIELAEQDAAAAGATLTAAERAAIVAEVEGWLVPAFTALPFGLPGTRSLR